MPMYIELMDRRTYKLSGNDMEIREAFRKFAKDDQFERVAAVADVTGLSLDQTANREGHILKVKALGLLMW